MSANTSRVCKWCQDGQPVLILDADGTRTDITRNPGTACHAYDDSWWPCEKPCSLCDKGFPINEHGEHYGAQSLGMVPSRRCDKLVPFSEPAKPIQYASDLIAHLERGGVIATGEPEHVLFLRYEMWEFDGKVHRYLGRYGWGSALGQVEQNVMDVLQEPQFWVKVPACKDADEVEKVAKIELAKLGKYVDYEWEWSVKDERPANQ